MKKILLLLAVCLTCASAFGQAGGLYPVIGTSNSLPNGGVPVFNNISLAGVNWVEPFSSTNTFTNLVSGATNFSGNTAGIAITSSNIIVDVHNYDNIGWTYSDTPGGGAMSNAYRGFQVFRSYDKGATFEAVAFGTYTNTNSAAGLPWVTNGNWNIPGCSALGFSFYDTVTNGFQSNVIFELYLKRPKYDVRVSPD